MTRIIFNADDLGYSPAVSQGIIYAHQNGLICSTTMMTNMPYAKQAAKLAMENPNLYVGQHTNVVIGKPCCDPKDVPSLVDENGYFNTKQRIKNHQPIEVEDLVKETRAQAERFKQLFGHYPTHIEGHAIHHPGLFQAIAIVAKQLGVHFTDVEHTMMAKRESIKDQHHMGYELPDYPDVGYYMDTVSLDWWLNDQGNLLSKDLVEMHTHPGFVDQYLLDHSTYNLPRAKELDIACDPRLKKWMDENHVQLITFEDIRKQVG